MPRQKREESGTGICHVMQGKESKTCPYDFSNRSENRPLIQTHFIGDKTICVVLLSGFFGYLAENNYFCGKLHADQRMACHEARLGIFVPQD